MIPLIIGAAAVGAAAGGISAMNRSKNEKKQLRQQRRMAQQAYEYEQEYKDAAWNLERKQNLENLYRNKNRLAEAFKTDMSGFNMGLEEEALQNEAALVSFADSAGMAKAQQGMSGVKGSEALQYRIDLQENQLRKQFSLQERQNSFMAEDITKRYSNQFNDIGREINSWNSGYRAEAKSLQDVYAAQMYGLRMQGFEAAISDAEATPLDYLSNIFSGAASGASFGGQMGSLFSQTGSGIDPAIPSQWSTQQSFPSATPGGQLGTSLFWNSPQLAFVNQNNPWNFLGANR